jgi:hypothetical protein
LNRRLDTVLVPYFLHSNADIFKSPASYLLITDCYEKTNANTH